jgi:hypothetical protein
LKKKVGQGKYTKYLSGLGKASKDRKFVLKMDNYYDVQRLEKDNKVSKAVTLFLVLGIE